MTRWETELTTRDTNRVVRPLEWGFDWLRDFEGGKLGEAVATQHLVGAAAGASPNKYGGPSTRPAKRDSLGMTAVGLERDGRLGL